MFLESQPIYRRNVRCKIWIILSTVGKVFPLDHVGYVSVAELSPETGLAKSLGTDILVPMGDKIIDPDVVVAFWKIYIRSHWKDVDLRFSNSFKALDF